MKDKRFVRDKFNSATNERWETDERVRSYIIPRSVIWKTDNEKAMVENEAILLKKTAGQVTGNATNLCVLTNKGEKAGLLLDFGVELQGGIQLLVRFCGKTSSTKLRIRFGESAMEAMSELGQNNSTNDHAMRDEIIEVSFMSIKEIGNTGFRFVRIDLLDEDSNVEIISVRAVFLYKDIEYKGSFKCNDELLNKIWDTGAYTVHLNMQNYLWDGIKRDRLVWIGDMHPEISTIQAVFGYDKTVPKSLDFVRDNTILPEWMNGIPTYSMWWILIHSNWYMHNGDKDYLGEQRSYLKGLLRLLVSFIDEEGNNNIPEWRFIDWPSSENKTAVDAGIHAMLILALEAGGKLLNELGDINDATMCDEAVIRLKKRIPKHGNSKQAAALMTLAGITDINTINNEILAVDGSKGLSAFLGYYVLKARAMAGDIEGSLRCIREYWGGMIKLGATTFWEDFNMDWLQNAAGIDEVELKGRVDVHGAYGAYCYKGYRHSLCHGWSSGPTPWLSEYILGIRPIKPGCKIIEIKPSLGDLEWAEGTYPTPMGNIYVKHQKQRDGSIKSIIKAPEGITVL